MADVIFEDIISNSDYVFKEVRAAICSEDRGVSLSARNGVPAGPCLNRLRQGPGRTRVLRECGQTCRIVVVGCTDFICRKFVQSDAIEVASLVALTYQTFCSQEVEPSSLAGFVRGLTGDVDSETIGVPSALAACQRIV